MNEGETLEDREQDGKEVNESLEENDEDEPIDGVDYYKLCCDHFDPNMVNELLPDERYSLDESKRPGFLHFRKRHHIWLGKYFKAIKAAGAEEEFFIHTCIYFILAELLSSGSKTLTKNRRWALPCIRYSTCGNKLQLYNIKTYSSGFPGLNASLE